MNELRQTKEYKLSDQGGEYTVPHKGADPVQVVLAQQIEELAEHDKTSLGFIQKKNKIEKAIIENQQALRDPSEYDGDIHQEDLDKAAAEGSKEFWPDPAPFNLEDQIQEIAERVKNITHDVIFQEIIAAMDDYDDLNWGHFVQDDAPTSLLDACFDHKTELHYEIFQLVLQKLK